MPAGPPWGAALVWFFLVFTGLPLATSQDVAQEEGSATNEPEKQSPATEDLASESTEQEADPGTFKDQALELVDKLRMLKKLLAERGESLDPKLSQQLQGLQDQLDSLGLSESGKGSVPAQHTPGSNPELTEFLAGCLSMALKRVGPKKPATVSAMKQMAQDKLSPAQAADTELWRLVAVCLNRLADNELEQFKAGKMDKLPDAHEKLANAPEAKQTVIELDPAIWTELKLITQEVLGKTDLEAGQARMTPHAIYGAVAAIPLLGMFGFLLKKFLDMKKREAARKDKKDKKKSK